MVRYCVAFGCQETYKKGNGIQFHKFPLSQPRLLKVWEHAVQRKDWRATVHSTLCSKHFTEDSYQPRPGALVKYLKENAVPSIFSFKRTNPDTRKPLRRLLTYKNTPVIETSNATVEDPWTESSSAMEIEQYIDGDHAIQFKSQSTQTDSSLDLHSPVKTGLRRKIKVLQSRIRRREIKIEHFSQMIAELKTKVKISSDLEHILKSNFSGFPLEFILNTHEHVNKTDDHTYAKMHVSNSIGLTREVSNGGLIFTSEPVLE